MPPMLPMLPMLPLPPPLPLPLALPMLVGSRRSSASAVTRGVTGGNQEAGIGSKSRSRYSGVVHLQVFVHS